MSARALMEGEHLSVVTRGKGGGRETIWDLDSGDEDNVAVMTIIISQKKLFFFQSKSHLNFKLLVKTKRWNNILLILRTDNFKLIFLFPWDFRAQRQSWIGDSFVCKCSIAWRSQMTLLQICCQFRAVAFSQIALTIPGFCILTGNWDSYR